MVNEIKAEVYSKSTPGKKFKYALPPLQHKVWVAFFHGSLEKKCRKLKKICLASELHHYQEPMHKNTGINKQDLLYILKMYVSVWHLPS